MYHQEKGALEGEGARRFMVTLVRAGVTGPFDSPITLSRFQLDPSLIGRRMFRLRNFNGKGGSCHVYDSESFRMFLNVFHTHGCIGQ